MYLVVAGRPRTRETPKFSIGNEGGGGFFTYNWGEQWLIEHPTQRDGNHEQRTECVYSPN